MSFPDKTMMMELMERLWPLHRTLVCDDMDRAMDLIGEYAPEGSSYTVSSYPCGQKVWTWTIPEKFVVEEAYLELLTEGGAERIVDFVDNPLHIVSYSPAFEGELSFEELEPHLYYNEDQPHTIPWVFKFYDRNWGFCLSYDQFKTLPRDGRFRVVMKTRFDDGFLRVGELDIPGESDETILFVAAVCHPMQVNDSITGVVTAMDLARELAAGPKGHYTIKMLFVPETIGTVAHLANNEDLIAQCKFGFFSEFIGHDATLRLQRTRQDDHLLDRVVRYVINKHTDGDFIEGEFCHTIITNDEKVTNAPGVDIPTVALNRWPWDKYHTTDDNPSAMNPERLAEVSLIYRDVVDILQKNFTPLRKFKGPLFLSGLDWQGFDWTASRKTKRAVQDVMGNLEGDLSAFDIALKVDLDFDMVLHVLSLMEHQDLIERTRSSV